MTRLLAGLSLLIACGCSDPHLDVKIPFTATWGGDSISCSHAEVSISDLRFYLSSIQLIDQDGEAFDLELHSNLPWQQSDLALVDLEDGQGPCANGTADVFAYLEGDVSPADYQALRFTVGVPFDRNHANPLTAEAPLDDPAMHWHWRAGYKFMRAGVKTAGDSFWLHVGSAGCEGTVRHVSGCRFPNRVDVDLQGFVPNRDTVEIDLQALFEGVDFSDGEPDDCSSGPAEVTCFAPFAALGIDFESGKRNGRQRVFSIHR